MKAFKSISWAAAVFLTAFLGVQRQSEAQVTQDFFYDALQPYGEWVDVADYGYCWRPLEVGGDWRPYTQGSWVYTDAGWTFVSDEPFGAIVYHYGRWMQLDDLGWVWAPGTEWGPAWVSWRSSDEYVGWAPLPPETRFTRSISLGAWVDGYYDIGPASYCFVAVRNFGAPRLRSVLMEPARNITVIQNTVNVTNIHVVNNSFYNEGPDFALISSRAEQPVRRVKLVRETEDFARNRTNFQARLEGDQLRLPAPSVTASEAPPPKVARKINQARVKRGWEGVAGNPEAEQFRNKVKTESKPPPGLPPQPELARPASKPDSEAAKVQPSEEQKEPARTEQSKRKKTATAEAEDTPPSPSTAAQDDRRPPEQQRRASGRTDTPRMSDPSKPATTAAQPPETGMPAPASEEEEARKERKAKAETPSPQERQLGSVPEESPSSEDAKRAERSREERARRAASQQQQQLQHQEQLQQQQRQQQQLQQRLQQQQQQQQQELQGPPPSEQKHKQRREQAPQGPPEMPQRPAPHEQSEAPAPRQQQEPPGMKQQQQQQPQQPGGQPNQKKQSEKKEKKEKEGQE